MMCCVRAFATGEPGMHPTKLAMIALSALAWAFSGSAQERDESAAIVFVTGNHSLADLELSMSAYYEQLSRRNQLPVQNIQDDLGAPVQALVFGVGLLRGDSVHPVLPKSMERLLCSMNPKVCTQGADGAAQWKNKKGDRICLPAVPWTDGVNFVRIPAPSKKMSDTALVGSFERRFGTCSALERSCTDAIRDFRATSSVDGTMETVVLAQMAHKSSAPTVCSAAPTFDASSKITELGWQYLRRLAPNVPIGFNEFRGNSASGAKLALAAPPRHPRTSPLGVGASLSVEREVARIRSGPAAAAAAASSAKAAEGEPRGAQLVEQATPPASPPALAWAPSPAAAPGALPPPLENATTGHGAVATPSAPQPAPIINDVFERADLIAYRDEAAPPSRVVRVLVFDWPVNGCHLVLQRAVQGLTGCPSVSYSSWTLVPAPLEPDHGNHVAALIGGGFGVGVAPYITIVPVKILGEGVTRFTSATYAEVAKQFSLSPLDTRVANFSADLKPDSPHTTDRIGSLIDARRGILFVAAAGNVDEGEIPASLDDSCDVVPACARPLAALGNNLIVVGGATGSTNTWSVWSRSRFGVRVDILAPALDVESAMQADGDLGRMSGSSQSAALVSGVAARLFESPPPTESEDWQAVQVKNRLIGTARFFTSLRKFTRSGLIDADRALDVSNQVLVVEQSGQRQVYEGKVLGVVRNGAVSETDVPLEVPPDNPTVDFCRIYRLSRSGPSAWTVAYQPISQVAATRWSQLELDHDVVLRASDKKIEFQPNGAAEPMQVALRDILEFYDKFSGELACRSRARASAPPQ